MGRKVKREEEEMKGSKPSSDYNSLKIMFADKMLKIRYWDSSCNTILKGGFLKAHSNMYLFTCMWVLTSLCLNVSKETRSS